MSPRKLTDADKKDILNLYQRLEETTSTLATRYDVSNSTISRILKSSLLESDYEALIQQKRSNRGSSNTTPIIETPSVETELASSSELPQPEVSTETDDSESVSTADSGRWRRRRSSVTPDPVPKPRLVQTELRLDTTKNPVSESDAEELAEAFIEIKPRQNSLHLEELLDDDLMDLDEDDEGDDEDDDDWEYDPAEAGTQGLIKTRIANGASIQVLPLSEASLPKTCYLVVDRAAELIARPLKEFGDLGRIPIEEIQEKTLPVFDNHRVARRFSNRSQRVIKVPDGRMLQKTCSHLQAKGITRLLIDGQVYSLMPEQPLL
jgi:DNA-binding transcriptional ArsR family regulator